MPLFDPKFYEEEQQPVPNGKPPPPKITLKIYALIGGAATAVFAGLGYFFEWLM